MKTIKRALLLFIAAGLAFSCSDDETPETVPSVTLPLVTKITTTGTHNRVYEVTYDVARRITKISITGYMPATYTFIYNADNLISNVAVDAASDVSYVLHYNEDKIYTGYTATPGGTNTASYDALTKIYDLTTAYGSGVHVKIDSDSDISTIHEFDEEDMVTFVYDTTVKGPFYNAAGNIHFVLSVFDKDFMYFATKKAPVRASMDVEQEYYKYTNDTYNGFVTDTELVTPDATMTIDYDFNWL